MDIKELLERRKREIYGEESYDVTMENFGDISGEDEDFGDITLEGFEDDAYSVENSMNDFFSQDELRNIDIQASMIEDPDSYIDEVIEEATNNTIELIGESYINDLILENALYDCETSEELLVVEESVKDSISSFKTKAETKVKELWAKFTAWIKNLMQTIKNQFTSGEKLVSKYKAEIQSQYNARKDKIKIKSYIYKADPGNNAAKCLKTAIHDRAIAMDNGSDKSSAVNYDKDSAKKAYAQSIGAKSAGKKDIKSLVALKIRNDEKKEIPLSSLDINVIIQYADGIKDAVKALKEMQKTENDFFKQQISTIKNIDVDKDDKEGKKKIQSRLTAAKQGSAIMSTVIKTYINEFKAAHRACTAIVRKLLNTSSKGGETETKLHGKIKKRL